MPHVNRKSSIDVIVSLKMGEAAGFTQLDNVSDIPDLGGTRENIEVTAIGDDVRKYIAGIREDASELEFTCFYERALFKAVEAGGAGELKIEIGEVTRGKDDQGNETRSIAKPEATIIAKGEVSASLAGFGVGDALTYTLKMNVSSIDTDVAAE